MIGLLPAATPDDIEGYLERVAIMVANYMPERMAEKLAADLTNKAINMRGPQPRARTSALAESPRAGQAEVLPFDHIGNTTENQPAK